MVSIYFLLLALLVVRLWRLLVVGCWWLHHDIEMKIAADADIESKIVSLYQHTYVEM